MLIDEPRIVDFGDISIPPEVHMIQLIDLIPLFLYIEALIAQLKEIKDFNPFKQMKMFITSSPIKPCTLIELDTLLLKQLIINELKTTQKHRIDQ